MTGSVRLQPTGGDSYQLLSTYRDRFTGARTNAHLHLSTLIRWGTRGVLQPDGSRAKLRCVRIGSRWFTTDEWVSDFIATLTDAHTGEETATAPRSPTLRQRESEAAGRELTEKYGI